MIMLPNLRTIAIASVTLAAVAGAALPAGAQTVQGPIKSETGTVKFGPEQPKSVMAVLPLLPTSAFDNTTEGLEADEFKGLLAKGTSENWTLKKLADGTVVIAAKHPSSEVHLSFKRNRDQDILEALTFNEKAVTYSYWVPDGAGKPLAAHKPDTLFRAVNETGERETPGSGATVPAELRLYIGKMDSCQHWSGEIGDDLTAARKREIAARMKALGCSGLGRESKALRSRFSGQPRWVHVLDRAEKIAGE